MLIIERKSTDPYFNIATEEYVLKNIPHNCFMLWQNERSIIVGKHQNTYAEINIDYVNKKNIPIVRRISGGGTVFHDMGNLNFSFLNTGKEGKLVDFRKYTQPIIDVLKKLHVDVKFEGKNNLTINGLKISGNAEHVFKNRVLHHGTLLFSSELTELNEAIKSNKESYSDRAVKSIRSDVTNISKHLKNLLSILDFRELVVNHIIETHPESKFYELTSVDEKKIKELVDSKYATWEWNYGYSPKYSFNREGFIGSEPINVSFSVEHGFINEVAIKSSFFDQEKRSILEHLINGLPHEKQKIEDKLMKSEILQHSQVKSFIDLLF